MAVSRTFKLLLKGIFIFFALLFFFMFGIAVHGNWNIFALTFVFVLYGMPALFLALMIILVVIYSMQRNKKG